MPTIIALDVSLSMQRFIPGRSEDNQITFHQLALKGIAQLLEHLAVSNKLEYVALVTYSTSCEVKVDFTRDYDLVRQAVKKVEAGDKLCLISMLKNVASILSTNWGTQNICQVVIFTDCGLGFGSTKLTAFLQDYVGKEQEPEYTWIETLKSARLNFMCLGLHSDSYFTYVVTFYQQLLDFTGLKGQLYMTKPPREPGEGSDSLFEPTKMSGGNISMQLPSGSSGPMYPCGFKSELGRTAMFELVERLCEANYKPYETVLKCGGYFRLECPITVWPPPAPFLRDDGTKIQHIIGQRIEVCGYVALSEIGSPSSLSRHLILPKIEREKPIRRSSDKPGSFSKPPMGSNIMSAKPAIDISNQNYEYEKLETEIKDFYMREMKEQEEVVNTEDIDGIGTKPNASPIAAITTTSTTNIPTLTSVSSVPNLPSIPTVPSVTNVSNVPIAANLPIVPTVPSASMPPTATLASNTPTSSNAAIPPEMQKECMCVLLHGALKVENLAALVLLKDNWYGFIYSFCDSKKKCNLMLNILPPGNNVIPWLGDLQMLGLQEDLMPGEVSAFPVKAEKRSYSQNCVVWIRHVSLQSDVQKVLRHAKKIPEKTQHFYKELNRIRRAALSIGFTELLEALATLFESECAQLPLPCFAECALHLNHAAIELRRPSNRDLKNSIAPLTSSQIPGITDGNGNGTGSGNGNGGGNGNDNASGNGNGDSHLITTLIPSAIPNILPGIIPSVISSGISSEIVGGGASSIVAGFAAGIVAGVGGGNGNGSGKSNNDGNNSSGIAEVLVSMVDATSAMNTGIPCGTGSSNASGSSNSAIAEVLVSMVDAGGAGGAGGTASSSGNIICNENSNGSGSGSGAGTVIGSGTESVIIDSSEIGNISSNVNGSGSAGNSSGGNGVGVVVNIDGSDGSGSIVNTDSGATIASGNDTGNISGSGSGIADTNLVLPSSSAPAATITSAPTPANFIYQPPV